MAANAGTPGSAMAAARPIPLPRRLYGFGSIYGKTIRDSRLAFIIAAGILGGMAFVLGAAISQVFPTPESRLEVNALIGSMPSQMVTLFGKPEKLGTLGGYMAWKYGATFTLGTALWSIMALSGTLAGEAGRGTLDVVAVAPFGKRRIALEKLAAHLTIIGLVIAVLAVSTTLSSSTFGDAALGDQIGLLPAVGFALWVGCIALFFGGLAFALGPLLGRAGAATSAGVALGVLWVAGGLNVVPISLLSPFRWTFDHVALVGEYDWPGLALVGIVAAAFLVIGVELFARRDLGITAGLRLPSLPAALLGVNGTVSRAFGDQLPRALGWGIGLGLVGAMLASIVGPMGDQIRQDTNLRTTFSSIFPTFDLASAGGFLQLFAELMFIFAGFAGATFVARWASDETGGRLEEVLATPTTRVRWVVAGGVAIVLATIVMTVLFAVGIALGAASGGVSGSQAMLGSAAFGLFALAVAGVGMAVGGVWRTSLAAEIAAVFVVATYLVDLLAPPLKLPDWVHQLAVTAHLGQPMVGQWDPVGIVACLVIFGGGAAIGAWGISRRDVAR